MKKNKVKFLILNTILWSSALVFISGMNAGAEIVPEIIVPERAMTSGENVLLGDIAILQGNLRFVKEAKNIVLGKAPFPGKERTFSRSQIITRLRQNDINMKKINLICPPEVEVLSDYIELTGDRIEQAVKDYIYKNMAWNRNWVRIDNFNYRPVKVPRGHLTLSVIQRSGNNFIGRMAFDVDICVGGQQNFTTAVSAVITVIAPVAKSATAIQRHDIVSKSDIVIQNEDITYQSSEIVFDANEIIGKRARTRILPDTTIKTSMVEEYPIIQKGDIVTIFVETDSFRISTSGKALEDGYKDSAILVSNLNSKNRLYGIVRNGNQVEVNYQ